MAAPITSWSGELCHAMASRKITVSIASRPTVTNATSPSAMPEPPLTAPETLARSSFPMLRLWRRIQKVM